MIPFLVQRLEKLLQRIFLETPIRGNFIQTTFLLETPPPFINGVPKEDFLKNSKKPIRNIPLLD